MEMSRLVTFYSNNFENNPVTFYQGCVSHKSQKDDLNNVTKLVVSQVSMTGCSHVFSDQFSSVIQSCSTLCNPMDRRTQASLSITNSQSLLKLMSIESVMPSNHLIQPSHPLSFPSPPAPNPSQHHGLFQRVNSSHEVAKVLEFQLQDQSFQRDRKSVV